MALLGFLRLSFGLRARVPGCRGASDGCSRRFASSIIRLASRDTLAFEVFPLCLEPKGTTPCGRTP